MEGNHRLPYIISEYVENKFCKIRIHISQSLGHPGPWDLPFNCSPLFPLSSISTPGNNSFIGATAREVAPAALYSLLLQAFHATEEKPRDFFLCLVNRGF
ncbi:hypothetical protein VNO80_23939 [Phaseolus coccineus]|uniref:Uncharacterized protein n=1 Tax=Phaseolus coccineus TaxID=3886 RepID=A0AAN9QKK4_PHACN